jgi:hypothetical protein
MKKIFHATLLGILLFTFCSGLDYSTLNTQAEEGGSSSSRDVVSPTTYVTEDQAHARLFSYDGTNFTNISAANQNISPEVNAIAWNDADNYWAIVARGRLWTYNGTAVSEIIDPDL